MSMNKGLSDFPLLLMTHFIRSVLSQLNEEEN